MSVHKMRIKIITEYLCISSIVWGINTTLEVSMLTIIVPTAVRQDTGCIFLSYFYSLKPVELLFC